MPIRRPARFLIAALALLVSAAAAQPLHLDPEVGHYVPRVSYLEDPGGGLHIEEVAGMRERFRQYTGTQPNFGYTRSAYWLAFDVETPHDDTESWYLQVFYPPLDRIEAFWQPQPGAAFVRLLQGDHLPFHAREIHEPEYYFPLALQPGQPRTVFLRVQTESSMTVPLALWSAHRLDEQRGTDHLVLGLFFGTLLALVLYNLLLCVSIRDINYLYYVAFVAVSGLAFFSYNGLAYQFLWPEAVAWNNRAPIVFALAALSFGAIFARNFLMIDRHSPRLDAALIAATIGAGLFGLLAIGVIDYFTSAHVFSAFGIAAAIAIVASGIVSWQHGYRPARWFLLAWSALLVGLIAYALRVLGALPGNFFTIYGIQVGSGLEMLLLSIALADRINVMKRETEEAHEIALAASRRAERELEDKVEERVGELNEVNRMLQGEISERRQAQEALFEMAHHDALTGLPNRLLLSDRFRIAAAQAARSKREIALLMMDLDGFKQVNDKLGHDIGDLLLVAVADSIQGTVRATDTIARFGGDEFIVLLNDLRDAEEATRVADQIILALAHPHYVGTHSLTITTSIGIALYPQDGSTLEALLKCADIAMYRAKEAGGHNYFFFLEGAQQQLSLPSVERE
ncbi:MAG: 7TM diverse intracellular signaling domain-containing protein [Burkholderiales bacterium]